MSSDRLRRRLAFEAARLIAGREETVYGRARCKAVQRLTTGAVDPTDMPSGREIRACIGAIARAEPAEQERLLTEVAADRALGRPTEAAEDAIDRFRTYELLLLPLEYVMQPPDQHPEGDVLYHSLQVFELARQRLPYDEELLTAALLHDVGKGVDPRDHVSAGLDALGDSIGQRTAWLIEHHVEALMLGQGTLGVRSRRRLAANESFDELAILAECDRRGRAIGAVVPDVYDALQYLRDLSADCDDAAPAA